MEATAVAAPYKATRDPDGKYTIEGVEIFGQLPKGARGNDRPIGKDWQESVIAYHAKREREDGYRPPIHIKHHGMSETTPAGFFRPTHVRQVSYKGRKMWALCATLYKIPASVFATIEDHGLPYRSIEILNEFDPKEPWISSVALLEDEEPYFSFRNLDGESIERINFERGTFGDYADGVPDVMYASSATGKESAWLFSRFPKLEVSEPMSETYSLGWSGSDVQLLGNDGKVLTTFSNFECKDKDEMIAKLKAKISDLEGKLSKFMEDEDKDKPEPVQAAAGGELVKMIGEQSGQLQTLSETVAEMKQTSELETRKAKAARELKEAGYFVSDATAARIETFAKMGDDALTEFVSAFKATATRDPDAGDEVTAPADVTDPVLAKFAEKGADALAKARDGDAHFSNLVEMGMYAESEREAFLTTHVGGAF